tara:strand:- start:1903 stop:4017 length:2115 start_codon:yes stop_codon:yes gene_type:complete
MLRLILLTLFFNLGLTQGYNMQLISHLPYEQNSSDITGFAQDGREFAVMGLQDAATFIDITDPYNPFEIDRIDGGNSIWRDLKYWNRHVYIGTEANDGIKVVSVDDPDNPILVNTLDGDGNTTFGDGPLDNSHNIHVDLDGYLYVVGADVHDVWIYDLVDPANPELVGTWTEDYCHDIEVYNNKLYCAGIYTGYFYIVDVSDKTNPMTLASHFTGLSGISTHDVAVTEDENYLFTGDENQGGHIKVWDISNYDNINLVDEYVTPEWETHSAHNLYVRPGENILIISYYADGTRVLDITDPTNLQEIAYYDFSDIEGLYVSNWGVYAYLPSGYIISSDIEQGLFVLELGGVSILHDDIQDVNVEVDGPYINFSATVTSFTGDVDEVTLNYSFDNENWSQLPMSQSGNSNNYNVVYVPDQEGVIIYYYITASNTQGQFSAYPNNENGYVLFVYGDLEDYVVQSFETENDWYVESDASAGIWELAVPNPTYDDGVLAQTDSDHSEEGERCFVTGNNEVENNSGQDDVDGGTTTLFSKNYDLSNFDSVLLTYWRWYTNNLGNNPGTDYWVVQVTNNGIDWVDLENTNLSNPSWQQQRFVLNEYINLSDNVQFRFIASDLSYSGDTGSGGSLVEAALDDFTLEAVAFDATYGDVNFDGNLDVLDVILIVNIILGIYDPTSSQADVADLNNDGSIDVTDIVNIVNIILNN